MIWETCDLISGRLLLPTAPTPGSIHPSGPSGTCFMGVEGALWIRAEVEGWCCGLAEHVCPVGNLMLVAVHGLSPLKLEWTHPTFGDTQTTVNISQLATLFSLSGHEAHYATDKCSACWRPPCALTHSPKTEGGQQELTPDSAPDNGSQGKADAAAGQSHWRRQKLKEHLHQQTRLTKWCHRPWELWKY